METFINENSLNLISKCFAKCVKYTTTKIIQTNLVIRALLDFFFK